MVPSSQEIVKKLNILINETICHGADAGGSYDQNERNLVKAIKSVVKCLGLDDEYEVVNCTENNINIVDIDIMYGDWYIVPKGTVKNKDICIELSMEELIQIANHLNKLAASVGINAQFVCIPEGVTFEQFRRG